MSRSTLPTPRTKGRHRDVWVPPRSWRSAKTDLDVAGLAVAREPEAGHFCLLDLRGKGLDDAALEAAGVLLTPGPLMGVDAGFYRLCHAAEPADVVAEAIKRVAALAA